MSNTKQTPADPRRFLVMLDGCCYLGELDPGVRQCVRAVKSATRFTSRGAARVAAGYRSATVVEVSTAVDLWNATGTGQGAAAHRTVAS